MIEADNQVDPVFVGRRAADSNTVYGIHYAPRAVGRHIPRYALAQMPPT